MTIDAPLILHREVVRPEWIDYNGHMNVAYYVMIGDHATDKLFDWIGMDEAYVKRENKSSFAVDMRVLYLRELLEGMPVVVKSQLIAHDAKRLHFLHSIEHETEGFVACLNEFVGIHIDMATRRSSPFPDVLSERIEALAAAHASLPVPYAISRPVGLQRA